MGILLRLATALQSRTAHREVESSTWKPGTKKMRGRRTSLPGTSLPGGDLPSLASIHLLNIPKTKKNKSNADTFHKIIVIHKKLCMLNPEDPPWPTGLCGFASCQDLYGFTTVSPKLTQREEIKLQGALAD